MATVRKRGKAWQVQVRIQGQQPQSRSFTTKADAVAWGKSREAELKGDTQAIAKAYTLRQLIADYKPLATFATWKHLRLFLNRSPFLDIPLAKLTKAHFLEYRRLCGKTLKPLSWNRHAIALKAPFKWLINEGYSPDIVDCLKGVGIKTPEIKRSRRLFPSEEAKLREQLKPRFNAVLTILLETSMRIGELIKTKKDYVMNGLIYLPGTITKNKKPRTIALSPRAEEAVKLLVSISKGETLVASKVDQTLRAAIKRAELIDFRIHDLRHEALSRMSESGLFGPAELMSQSGHSSLPQLARYIHANPTLIQHKLRSLSQSQLSSQHREEHSPYSNHLPHSMTVPQLSEALPTLELVD